MENVSVQICTESDFTKRQDLTFKKKEIPLARKPAFTHGSYIHDSTAPARASSGMLTSVCREPPANAHRAAAPDSMIRDETTPPWV
jgi:hypothetical protein